MNLKYTWKERSQEKAIYAKFKNRHCAIVLEVRIVITSVRSGIDQEGTLGASGGDGSTFYLDLGDHHMATVILGDIVHGS